MSHLKTTLLIAVGFIPTSTHADDLSGDYQGRLRIESVARFYDLPTRLFLRPEFRIDVAEAFLPDGLVQLFTATLEGDYDSETQIQAARSLQRIAQEKLADPEDFATALRKRLTATSNRDVKRACAMALAYAGTAKDAAALAELCLPNDEVLCRSLEPRIAAWKSNAMLANWTDRIRKPVRISQTLVSLACQGVAELNTTNLIPDVKRLVVNTSQSLKIRIAAARSLATVSPGESYAASRKLERGSIADRILAATLLSCADSDGALELLEALCDDREAAVASIAWKTLLELDPHRLLVRLAKGASHGDSNVRRSMIRVVEVFPSAERCDMVHLLMSDRNIEVRNLARNVLQSIAEKDDALRQTVQANAADVTGNVEVAWEHLEQSMLLIGCLGFGEIQAKCIPLLAHDRPEVFVTAAWLLHLMPKDQLGKAASVELLKKASQVGAPEGLGLAYGHQCVFLAHVVASTGRKEVIPFLNRLFPVPNPMNPNAIPYSAKLRASGLWALSLLRRNSKDESLSEKYVGRIFYDGDPPEEPEVVWSSALSLGFVGAPSSVAKLQLAHQTFGLTAPLGDTISTSLRMLGEEAPPRPPPVVSRIGDWPIGPAK